MEEIGLLTVGVDTVICDTCGEEIKEGEFYHEHEGKILCIPHYLERLDSVSEDCRDCKKKSFIFLLRCLVGVALGLVIGLDIYFGFGILCDNPTHILIAPILLPLFASLLIAMPKQYIGDIKDYYNKWLTGDSAGEIFIAILVTAFRAIIVSPFFSLYMIGTTVYAYIKAIRTLKAIDKSKSSIMNIYGTFDKIMSMIEERS